MSETVGMTLTDFLLARVDEDRDRARYWDTVQRSDHALFASSRVEVVGGVDRLFREAAAKRRIVERLQLIEGSGPAVDHVRALDMQTGGTAALRDAAAFLAAIYGDHPDYRPEWRTNTP